MNKNRPVIGVTTMFDAETERYTLKRDYPRMLEALGAVPVLLPLTADPVVLDHYLELCDGLILSGGYDVDPALYGQADEGLCKQIQPVRDEMEFYLCRRAVAEDLPLLGICRGHQVLNAALGGTLYQDLQAQMGTTLQHQVPDPVGGFAHDVSLAADSPLARLLGKDAMAVNSRHHQGIRDLASGLEAQAAADDGTVESVWMPGKRFIWGVQWHPEGIWDISGENRKIVEAFLDAAKGETV